MANCDDCSFYCKNAWASKCENCTEYDGFEEMLPLASNLWKWKKNKRLVIQSGVSYWTSPLCRFFYGRSESTVDVAGKVAGETVTLARFYVLGDMESAVRRARELCEREEARCRRVEKRA